ncbi:FAD:protein FMN transferase [Bacterioplanoides sp.]|uniref:FAD:protein FMN transferase n=1 Tax=Bacterioplanoides sp. TaxID=2066072 RepID=UPI003AFFAFC9
MHIHRFSFTAMASPCELHLLGDAKICQQAAQQAEQEVKRIEQKYSRYRPDSVLSQINQQAGSATTIDPETYFLLNYAQVCFQQSEGLFDISSGVLRQAWNFKQPRLPDPSELTPLLERIGLADLELSENQVQMPATMEIDFGGIGKEYAADRAAAVCRQHGIHSGIVDLGGDLLVLGPKPDGSPWHLGVRNPRPTISGQNLNQTNNQAFAQLPVYEGGMATSGDYERFFELQGKRYCHLLNPHTGLPVDHWASVTVLAPSCLLAGTFSTIAMLKQAAASDWLKQQGLHFLAIYPDGSHLAMSGSQ